VPSRLRAVAAAIPPGATVADVGCGDGQLARLLREHGHDVIATELRPGPAARARERLGDCRLGDGLEPLGLREVEVAVIAGMGGNTIRGILERTPDVAAALERIVLQPQQRVDELRTWLQEARYELLAEHAAVDRRRPYTVLVVRAPR
jgi:tRNA (adenine22-N1)-methyltransferase